MKTIPAELSYPLTKSWSNQAALKCADWLEQHGEHDRAELIRFTVEEDGGWEMSSIKDAVSMMGQNILAPYHHSDYKPSILKVVAQQRGRIYFVIGRRGPDGKRQYRLRRFCPATFKVYIASRFVFNNFVEARKYARDLLLPPEERPVNRADTMKRFRFRSDN